MALAYLSVRQYDLAINDARLRLETLPENFGLHWWLRDAYRRKGALKEAAQEWEKAMLLSGDKKSAASIRRAFEEGGYKAVLLRQVSYLKEKSATQYVSPVDLALPYAQLDRRKETLSLLEEGYRQHSPQLLWIQNDPAYDFLHADERYRSIIRRVGLPPAY
jgi:tetratricopeptide (TPR) repeat protein